MPHLHDRAQLDARAAAAGQMTSPTPRVTISLVTFNGERWLPGCLASISRQSDGDYELLMLDNASSDRTSDLLRRHEAADSRASFEQSVENLGFARAHNRNIERARGEYVVLLNQDVELHAGFLEAAVALLEQQPGVAGVQGLLLRLAGPGERTDVVDSTGLEMHRDRRVIARRQGLQTGARDLVPGPVWGVDGPAAVYRRAALVQTHVPRRGGGMEVLDEDFFMYKEDVDLAWRLRLLGWSAWYEPGVVAWHARGAGGGRPSSIVDVIRSDRLIPQWIKSTSWRNHRLMQLKNERVGDYLRDLPWIAGRELVSLGFMTLVDPRRLLVVADFARLARSAVRKRSASWTRS